MRSLKFCFYSSYKRSLLKLYVETYETEIILFTNKRFIFVMFVTAVCVHVFNISYMLSKYKLRRHVSLKFRIFYLSESDIYIYFFCCEVNNKNLTWDKLHVPLKRATCAQSWGHVGGAVPNLAQSQLVFQ